MSGFKDQNMNEVKTEGIESEIRVALSHIPYVYFIYDIVKGFVSVHKKEFRIVRAGSLDSFDYLGNDEVSS